MSPARKISDIPRHFAFVSEFIKFVLNASGIGFEHQKFKWLISILKYYLFASFALLTVGQIIFLKECKAMHEFTITLAYILSGIFLNMPTFVAHLNKTHIIDTLIIANTNIYDVMQHHRHVRTSDEKLKNFFFSYGNKLGDSNTLLVPCWFPWNVNSLTTYIFTILLEFTWLFPLSIPALLYLMFVVYFIIEVRTQYDILCCDILKMKNNNSTTKCQDINRQFKQCINHHRIIRRFVEHFCSFYNWVFVCNLMYSMANLSLLLFGIVLGERSISAVLQQISAFVMVISFLFLYCFVGEVLRDANDNMKNCLYDIEWFEESIEFKKMFLSFMYIIQRNLNLKAGKHIASYQLLSSVLKLAYSYFNVLRNAFTR